LLFRRIYTPAFPTTVNNHNTMQMNEAKFRKFIQDPLKYSQSFIRLCGLSQEEERQLEKLEFDYDDEI